LGRSLVLIAITFMKMKMGEQKYSLNDVPLVIAMDMKRYVK
jgi:hypothetical protein